MKRLNKFIFEKLKLSNKKHDTKQTEEVLIIQCEHDKNKGFDLSLFLTGIEHMYKDYEYNDILFSVNIHGIQEYYSLFNTNGLNPNNILCSRTVGNGVYLTISTFFNSELCISKNGTSKLIDILNNTKYKKFKEFKFYSQSAPSNGFINTEFMYVWPSEENDCIKIHLTDENYEKLKSKNTFI